MIRLRFLQISDLHFGAPMTTSKLGLPPEKQAQRHREFEQLVQGLPKIVQEHAVDVVFLPGDVWDQEQMDDISRERFLLLYTALVNMSVPVVISPGNHDYYSPRSFYHPDTLKNLGLAPWPEQVVIFTEPKFQSRWLPGWENKVQLTGRAFYDNTEVPWEEAQSAPQERLLASIPPRESVEALDILLFHGARDDFSGRYENITAPFSTQELLQLNFDYVALGHYHQFETFSNVSGDIKGAYAGCPFPRGLDETGQKHALVGEFIKEGSVPARVTLEKLSLDVRQIYRLQHVPVSGHESLEGLEEYLFKTIGAQAGPNDMVLCQLQGQLPAGMNVDWMTLENQLNGSFFHVRLDTSQISVAYDVERFREDLYSIEGRFIAHIETQLAQVNTDAERRVLEKALYLGLDALTGQGVRTP